MTVILNYQGREIEGKQCPSCFSKKIAKSFIKKPWPYVCLDCKIVFILKNIEDGKNKEESNKDNN